MDGGVDGGGGVEGGVEGGGVEGGVDGGGVDGGSVGGAEGGGGTDGGVDGGVEGGIKGGGSSGGAEGGGGMRGSPLSLSAQQRKARCAPRSTGVQLVDVVTNFFRSVFAFKWYLVPSPLHGSQTQTCLSLKLQPVSTAAGSSLKVHNRAP